MILEALMLLRAVARDDAPPNAPATPIYQPAPEYPLACEPKEGAEQEPASVTVIFDISEYGIVENPRIKKSTNSCFNDAALETVRAWRYDPRRSGGFFARQENVEKTFTFVFEKSAGDAVAAANSDEPDPVDRDIEPSFRTRPDYPWDCAETGAATEIVTVELDIATTGMVENARVIESTNECVNEIALATVKNWRYPPKIVDGNKIPRKGVQAKVYFRLYSSTEWPRWRREVMYPLKDVGMRLRRDDDPNDILADLEKIEEEYGDSFTRNESAVYHQMRGLARAKAGDYRGALDDLRIARRLGVDRSAQESISETIDKLEAIVAEQDAAATAVEETESSTDK